MSKDPDFNNTEQFYNDLAAEAGHISPDDAKRVYAALIRLVGKKTLFFGSARLPHFGFLYLVKRNTRSLKANSQGKKEVIKAYKVSFQVTQTLSRFLKHHAKIKDVIKGDNTFA